MMDNERSLTLASLFLCILLFIRSLYLRRQAAQQAGLVIEKEQALRQYQEKMKKNEGGEPPDGFLSDLEQATMTTGLQRSRLSLQHNRGNQRPPERYGYVKGMFRSGMAMEDIASALGMSSHELAQLHSLTTIVEAGNGCHPCKKSSENTPNTVLEAA